MDVGAPSASPPSRRRVAPIAIRGLSLALTIGLGSIASSSLAAIDPARPRIEFFHLPPSCPSEGDSQLNLLTILWRHFNEAPGSIAPEGLGVSVLYDGQRFLFPSETWNETPARLFDRPEENAVRTSTSPSGMTTEVLAESVPVLVSPYEVVFAWPVTGSVDWLGVIERGTGELSEFADACRVEARLVRHRARNGAKALSLELPGAGPLTTDLLRYAPEYAILARVETPDDSAVLYNFGKQYGRGSRLSRDLAAWRSEAPGALVLHPGNALDAASTRRAEACARALGGLGVDAIALRQQELSLGVDGVLALAERHRLTFLAANVLDARSPIRHPFARYLLREIAGLKVAIIGVTGREQLDPLSPSERAAWKIEEPRLAITRVAEDIRRLHGRPDLTIALVGARGDDFASVGMSSDVDVVVADARGSDLLSIRNTAEFVGDRPRETSRNLRPLAVLRTSATGLGRVSAEYESAPSPHRARLRRVLHDVRPILAEGPVDLDLERDLRAIEVADAEEFSSIALPNVSAILPRHEELAPLVWGEGIIHRGGLRRYPRDLPGRFSDPLWMRLVANILKDSLRADVALSRNLPRSSDMTGPVSRGFVLEWLKAQDALRTVVISGERLLALLHWLRSQQDPGRFDPAQAVFFVGADASAGVVGGHPIEPRARYSVVTTDYVLDMPEPRELLAKSEISDRFRSVGKTRFVADDRGKELLLRDVVLAQIAAWADGQGRFDARNEALVEAALLDDPFRVGPLWRLVFDEVSIQGSRYANSAHIEDYRDTQETRATTPNNTRLGVRGHVALVYEGPSIAWETRAKATLDRLVVQIEGQDIPPQEQADDLLFSTELRLNAVRLNVGDAGLRLVPFVQTAFDTEFTPTRDISRADGATLPHQRQWRSSLGFVMHPGPRLKEIRLGGVFQLDLSGRAVHRDAGITAAYRLSTPVVGPLSLSSELELLYFVPDRDDRTVDLMIRGHWVNKLLAPIVEPFSVFALADVAFFAGKTEGTRSAASWILGGGLELSALLTL